MDKDNCGCIRVTYAWKGPRGNVKAFKHGNEVLFRCVDLYSGEVATVALKLSEVRELAGNLLEWVEKS